MLLGATLLAVATALLALGAAIARPSAWEAAVLSFFRRSDAPDTLIGPAWLLDPVTNLTSLGSSTITGLVALVSVTIFLARNQVLSAAFIVLAFGGAEILSNGIKLLVGRARPEVVPHLIEVGGLSFPSGHSTLSAATYLALALLSARIEPRPAARRTVMATTLAVIFFVGLSRVLLGVHYPTDVLGGWCIGSAWTMVLWAFWNRAKV